MVFRRRIQRIAANDNEDCATRGLRRQVKDSFAALMKAHNGMELPRRVILKYEDIRKFDCDSEELDARQFAADSAAERLAVFNRARQYHQCCQDRVLACTTAHQRHIRELCDVLSRQHCVYRLPPEILGYIFFYTVGGGSSNPGAVLNLCRVSSQWRAVAVSTPSLWRHISIRVDPEPETKEESREMDPELDPQLIGDSRPSLAPHAFAEAAEALLSQPEHVFVWASRAGRLSLKVDMQWHASAYESTPKVWLDLFASLRERLHTLKFGSFLAEKDFSALFFAPQTGWRKKIPVPYPFPQLRQLSVSTDALPAKFHGGKLILNTPNLQSLNYQNICHNHFGDHGSPAVQWTSLPNVSDVTLNQSSFWDLLIQAEKDRSLGVVARLVTLNIGFKPLANDPNSVGMLMANPVIFPSLGSLIIHGPHTDIPVAALEAIRLPALHSLTCECTNTSRKDMRSYLDTVLRDGPCATLTDLKLDHVGGFRAPQDAARLFREIPKLVILRLWNMNASMILVALSTHDVPETYWPMIAGTLITATAAADTTADPRSKKSLLPCLRHLELWRTKWTSDSLEAVLHHRGLIADSKKYPPRADKRCLPLERFFVDGARDPLPLCH